MLSGATSGQGGTALGVHLANGEQNERVSTLAARDLGTDGIRAQIDELTLGTSHARGRGRRIYHLHVDPPAGWDGREDVYEDYLARVEAELGLERQQRAGVEHSKVGEGGRRSHRHYAWSLVRDDGSLIRTPHDFARRQRCAVETAHKFGMPCPPLAHARAVHAALLRMGRDDVAAYLAASGELDRDRRVARKTPRDRIIEERTGVLKHEVEAAAYEAWRASSGATEFRTALAVRGLALAMGDRVPVLVDRAGTAHRLTGTVSGGAKMAAGRVIAAEVHARIDGLRLPALAAVRAALRSGAEAPSTTPAEVAPVGVVAPTTPRKARAAARAQARAGAAAAGRKGRRRAGAERQAAPATAPGGYVKGWGAPGGPGAPAAARPRAGPRPETAREPVRVPEAPPTTSNAYRADLSFEEAHAVAFGRLPEVPARPVSPPRRAARPTAPQAQAPARPAPRPADPRAASAHPVAPATDAASRRPSAAGADLHAPGWRPWTWWTALVAQVRRIARGEEAPPATLPQVPPTPVLPPYVPVHDLPLDYARAPDEVARQGEVRLVQRILGNAGVADAARAADLLVKLRQGPIVHDWRPAHLAGDGTPAAAARQRAALAERTATLAEAERRIRAAGPPALPSLDELWLAWCRRAHGAEFARTDADIARARADLAAAQATGDRREIGRATAALAILDHERRRMLARLRGQGGRDADAWDLLRSDAARAPAMLDELRLRQLRGVRDEHAAVRAAILLSRPAAEVGSGRAAATPEPPEDVPRTGRRTRP